MLLNSHRLSTSCSDAERWKAGTDNELKTLFFFPAGGETEEGGRRGQEEGRWRGQEEEGAVQHGRSLRRVPGQGGSRGTSCVLLLNTEQLIPAWSWTRFFVPCRRSRRGASGKRPEKSRRRRWRRGASRWLSRTWERRVWGQRQVLRPAPGSISEDRSSNHFIPRCFLGREPRRCGTASTSWSRRSLNWLRRWRGRSMRWAARPRTSQTD